jgi:xanthine dehydrogenase accessory factor
MAPPTTHFSVGLTCGGIIDILVQPVDNVAFVEHGALVDSVAAGEPVALATDSQRGRRPYFD